jgi:SpoIID/LytB domain protein
MICLLLACILLVPAASFAKGEKASEVRVLLRRLYLTDRADLTLSGRYLARSESGPDLLLTDGAKVTILLQDQRLTLFAGGVSADMGKKLTLLRQDSGNTAPGIRFNLQAGFYPGDLSLSIEKDTDSGALRIIPILTLPVETYLQGVVPYEMGDGFPEEALKAQAVCARTYALSHLNPDAVWDVVDTTNDQVFRGIPENSPKSLQAVADTTGLVLTCDGKLITAWYGASNGGQTELPSNIWKGDVPRCFAMTDDPWDAENPESTVRISTLNRDGTDLSPAFVKLLRQAALNNPSLKDSVPEESEFRIQRLTSLELTTPRYAAPSRLMTQLQVAFEIKPVSKNGVPGDETASEGSAGGEDEDDLDITELISAVPMTVTLDLFPETVIALGLSVSGANNEIITLKEDETSFTLTAGRYGHGVGLSQRGAQQMAREGEKTFREILSFYFPGAKLKEYAGETAPLPTPPPLLARDPGPAPTATPRPTLMPVTEELPEGARRAKVENIADDSTLNLRAQPSAGAEILMRLYRHQELIVLEKSDVPGWVRVKTDVIEGYVMESFLVYEEEPSPES